MPAYASCAGAARYDKLGSFFQIPFQLLSSCLPPSCDTTITEDFLDVKVNLYYHWISNLDLELLTPPLARG
jgi:hypothetical protein